MLRDGLRRRLTQTPSLGDYGFVLAILTKSNMLADLQQCVFGRLTLSAIETDNNVCLIDLILTLEIIAFLSYELIHPPGYVSF